MQRRENLRAAGLRGWPKFKSFCTAREGGTPKFGFERGVFSGIADHFSNGSEQKISGRPVAQL